MIKLSLAILQIIVYVTIYILLQNTCLCVWSMFSTKDKFEGRYEGWETLLLLYHRN